MPPGGYRQGLLDEAFLPPRLTLLSNSGLFSLKRMPTTAFAGGEAGGWEVESIDPVSGLSLLTVPRLAVFEDSARAGNLDAAWILRGRASHSRYTRRDEQEALSARQAGLGRPEATRAALIPISKSQGWWTLAQDERRELFEETSHHIAIGMQGGLNRSSQHLTITEVFGGTTSAAGR